MTSTEIPELIDLVFNGTINPGKVFDLVLPLAQVAEGYRVSRQAGGDGSERHSAKAEQAPHFGGQAGRPGTPRDRKADRRRDTDDDQVAEAESRGQIRTSQPSRRYVRRLLEDFG